MMEFHDICKVLPQRPPILMIDKVLECVAGKSLTAVKAVTVNEKFFKGHFPDHKIMPGVLITESMIQASGLLFSASLGDGKPYDFCPKNIKVKFLRPVVPGDVLTIETVLSGKEGLRAGFKIKASVGQEPAASGSCEIEAKGV